MQCKKLPDLGINSVWKIAREYQIFTREKMNEHKILFRRNS